MDLPIALHTAARAFCANQHSRWSGEYMPLVESGQDRVASDYSKAAYGLFPRYRLDEAIEVEVERITGYQFPSLEDTRKLLLEGGNRAFSSLLQEFQRSPEACVALTDEWRAFEAYISSLDAVQLARIEPLPYRRVLTESESGQLRQKLSARWGAKGYWYPLAKCAPHTNVVAFHQELWRQRDATSLLLQAMQERGIERCFLLLEGPVDYEVARVLWILSTGVTSPSSQAISSGLFTVRTNPPLRLPDGWQISFGRDGEIGRTSPTEAPFTPLTCAAVGGCQEDDW